MSLSNRLLLVASLVLVVFLGLAGFALDQAFRRSAEAAEQDRLQSHIYALLSAADLREETSLNLPSALPESRFNTPQSGLYARVLNHSGDVIWRSESLVGVQPPFTATRRLGAAHFARLQGEAKEYFAIAFAVAWEVGTGRQQRYTFQVSETLDRYLSQVKDFQASLWRWFAGIALILLGVQAVILRWGLTPLRRVSADLEQVKAGRSQQLATDYPKELAGLTESINSFIESERAQQRRYRDSLADLAHSLKTPLAVLRGTAEDSSIPDKSRANMNEQLERMNQIVEYQLQRAATARSTLGGAVELRQPIKRMLASLDKVYASRNVRGELHGGHDCQVRMDEGDLMEVLGNVLDNAYKWARARVTVTVVPRAEAVAVEVEDDGPGIPDDHRDAVLRRGVRADQSASGQGIGLAVVQDILQAYDATLSIDRAPALGGARVTLFFPG